MSFNDNSVATINHCKPESDTFLINYYASNTARYNLRPETCRQSVNSEYNNSNMNPDNILPTRTRFRQRINKTTTNGTTPNMNQNENNNHEVYNTTQNRGRKRPKLQRTPIARKQRKIEATSCFNDCTGSAEKQPQVDAGNKNLTIVVDLSKITLPECSIKLKNNLKCINKDVKETNNEIDTCSTENTGNGINGGFKSTVPKDEEKTTEENISVHTPLTQNLQDDFKPFQSHDDSISLYASSIAEENYENTNQQSSSGDNSYIIDWLQKLQNQKYDGQNSNFNNTPLYNNHHHNNNRQYRFNRPRINFSNWHNNNTTHNNRMFLLRELNDICKFYFFEGNCIFRKCRYFHCLHNAAKNHLLKLPIERFKYIYDLSKEYQNLYFPILELFIMKLSLQKSANELVALIDDVMQHECLDRSQYVEQIVYGLQNMGLSLSESVTKIFISQFNKDTSSCVNEMLLNIIVKKSTNLEENWYLVKKLTQNFQEMDFGVVTDIIQVCLNKQPPSYSFCMHICKDILEKFDVNLYNISEVVLDKFKNLLRSMELTVYANKIDLVQEKFEDDAEYEEDDNKSLIFENEPEQYDEAVEDCYKETQVIDDNAANFVNEDESVVLENSEKLLKSNENEMRNVDNTCITELHENERKLHENEATKLIEITFLNHENEATKLNKENDTTVFDNENLLTNVGCDDNNTASKENNVEKGNENVLTIVVADETTDSSITQWVHSESRCSEQLVSLDEHQGEGDNFTKAAEEKNCISNNEVNVQDDENVDDGHCDKIITSRVVENEPKTPNIVEKHIEMFSNKINITSIVNLPLNSPEFSLNSHKNTENEPTMNYEEMEEDRLTYPESINGASAPNVELLEEDIIRLNEVIRKESIDGFTVMLRKHKNTFLHKSFILNVIVILRNQNKLFKNYVESLIKFQKTLIGDDREVKTLLESLALNLIETLGEKGKWNKACSIFELFYDVEDIINAECYVNKKSLLQRYFFSCLIFIRGDELDRASHLIKNSKVNILDINTWTDYEERDIHRQITILNEYFNASIENNLLLQAYDLICYIIKKRYVLKIDIWKYLNDTILKMKLDFRTYCEEMHTITNNILSDVWDIKKISSTAVRSLMITMSDSGFKTSAISLFQKCSQFGIYYNRYDGTERSVVIRVDMSIEEMIMVLSDFLTKLFNGKFKSTDITIHICFPLNIEEVNCTKNILDVNSVKKNIQKILRCLLRPVPLSFSDDDSTDIVLKAGDVAAFIKSLRGNV